MAEEITHLVYQNWTVQRSRVHVVGCRHYKKHGGGSGRNSKWYYCSNYQEANSVMNSFGYEDTGDCSCVFESELVGKDFGLHEDTKRNEELEDFIDELIKQSIEKRYTPLVFINMRNRYGTVKAIKRLVVSKDIQSGFRRLQELDLLHLSVERAVLEFPEKFTLEEQESARWKLEQVGYDFRLQKDIKVKRRVSCYSDNVKDENKGEQSNEKGNDTIIERHRMNKLLQIEFWQVATIEEVTKVINDGADIKARDEVGLTPLHWACGISTRTEVIKLLLDRGANIEARDEHGKTPIHVASAFSTTPDVISLLLDAGADVEALTKTGLTPLGWAAAKSKTPEVISLLLDRGANIEARDKYGWTPIFGAVNNENRETFSLLLNRDANIESCDEDGKTLLHWAAMTNETPDVISLLLDRGADIESSDNKHGWTPLHVAVCNGKLEVISFLLERRANIECRDKIGLAPIHLAETRKVISLLLDKGANIEARNNNGRTAIFGAKTPEAVSSFLDRGADIEARDKDGFTPLHLAAANKTPEVISFLLDRGAKAKVRNNYGMTPFDLAEENEYLKGSDVYWRLNEAQYDKH